MTINTKNHDVNSYWESNDMKKRASSSSKASVDIEWIERHVTLKHQRIPANSMKTQACTLIAVGLSFVASATSCIRSALDNL